MKTKGRISIIIFCFLIMSLIPLKTFSQISIGISVRIAPPELPVYAQPPCPEDGYLWTPGYWAYNGYDYYWVPGVWVQPPRYGYYWTPCWWGYSGGYYGFHEGYWGPHIGFYGGVNYGYGYGGSGYYGGRWENGGFRYNTAVVNVNNRVVHNTYEDRTVIVNNNYENHTSFNGPGGVMVRPSARESMAEHENHVPITSEQTSHRQVASQDRNQFVSVNKGKPYNGAMNKVGGQAYNTNGHLATLGSQKPAFHEANNQFNRPVSHSTNSNQGSKYQSKSYQQGNNTPKPNNNSQNQKSHNSGQGRERH